MMTEHYNNSSQCDNDFTNGRCCSTTGNVNNINQIDQPIKHPIMIDIKGKHNTTTTTTTTNNNNNNNKTHRNTMSCSPMNNENPNDDNTNDQSSSSNCSTKSDNDKRSLKSLLKKKIDPKQDFIKSHNKRVKFCETMQVFCYEMPDNQMPQIIALKPDVSLMEFQTYMYDPPAEYQDLLTFEPPPDYRDFIANSLNVFRNEVTFDFIDDDDDSENIDIDHKENRNNLEKKDCKIRNDPNQNSKWKSMILNNNLDSLEEEQIIGVLKEDDILQAIGSQVTLPVGVDPNCANTNGDNDDFEIIDANSYEENLSSADFPVHHLNSYFLNSSGHLEEDDEDACCIDSSPNGSLQDLASDSSITSQDTIILINQNKSFHLEPVTGNHQLTADNENIYENVDSCNKDLNVLSIQMLNGSGNDSSVDDNMNDIKDNKDLIKEQNHEVVYENTGELLSSATSLMVANQVKSLENASSTEECKNSDSKTNKANNNNNNTENIPLKKNILFYEKIVEQNKNINSNKHLNDATNNTVVSMNIQVNTPTVHKYVHQYNSNSNNNTMMHGLGGGGGGGAGIVANNLLPLPCYTILETSRTSSSSSLSSNNSSTSSLVPASVSCNIDQTSSQPPLISTSTSIPLMIKSQVSPNSNSSSVSPSSSSSSTSTSNIMINDFITSQPSSKNPLQSQQQPATAATATPTLLNPTLQQINITIPDKNIVNNANNNNVANQINPTATYSNISGQHATMPNLARLSGPPQSHICIVNNVSPNSATLRPGQVIYRYPYAVIQPDMNGINTIRPVQYIVQTGNNTTNSNTIRSPSIIYNPKLVVSNRIGSYTISSIPNVANNANQTAGNAGVAGAAPNNTPINVMPKQAAIIQQAQIVVPNSNELNTVPIRRIILPQGTAVLAPRNVQLHPQHKFPPPGYQCYVSQPRTPGAPATVMAYPPNTVQIRQTTIRSQYPINDLNPNQNNNHAEFPNASEIRRRDGLYAYPQVLIKKNELNRSSQNNETSSVSNEQSSEEKDELEAFVQQEHQRTERIKKRYSFTEDDDPTFGFARRPSVRGIRPKFNSTNEIIQQITSTMNNNNNNNNNTKVQQVLTTATVRQIQAQPGHPIYLDKSNIGPNCSTLPKQLTIQQQQPHQFIQINPINNPHMISIVKQMGDMHVSGNNNNNKNIQAQQGPGVFAAATAVPLKSQTLPRQLSQAHKIIGNTNGGGGVGGGNQTINNTEIAQHEIVRIIDASMLNNPTAAATATLTRTDPQKLQQLQKCIERQASNAAVVNQQQQFNQKMIAQRVLTGTGTNHLDEQQQRVPVSITAQTFSPNHPVPNVNNNNNIINNNNNNNNNNNHNNNTSNSNTNHNVEQMNEKTNLVNDNNKPNSSSDLVYYSLNV